MPFTVYVAADVYMQKVNLEIELPQVPTVSELIHVVQTTFNSEAIGLKPASLALQTIRVTKLQLYRDEDGTWVDLTSPTQLSEFAQLYVFQADPQYQESQQPIPAARRPSRMVPISPVSAAVYTPVRAADTTPLRAATPLLSTARAGASMPPAPEYGSYRRTSPPRPAVYGNGLSSSPVPLSTAVTSAVTPRNTLPAAHASPERSHLARQPVPEPAAPRDKISYLFDEMDTNGNRVIEPEEFRSLIRSLGIDFSNATLADLFAKGDLDRDGVMSMNEFAGFFASFPTLLDAAFYRLRDIQEARNLQALLADERRALDAARDQRARAAATAAECARLVAEASAKARDAEAEQAQRLNREAEVRHVSNQCITELELARRAKEIAQGDSGVGRDREASQRVTLSNAESDSREADLRVLSQQETLTQCQEKERQLHQLLIEAQRETERQHHALLAAQAEGARRRDVEQANATQLADCQRELQRLLDRLAIADREEMLKTERQRELQAALVECGAEVERITRMLDERRHEVALCADREKSNRIACGEAEAAVLAAERRLMARDQDIVSFNQRRAAMEQQERPLLEQEIRLREQRDTLDQKEVQFRRGAVTYFDSTRIGGPATGTSGYKSLSPPRQH